MLPFEKEWEMVSKARPYLLRAMSLPNPLFDRSQSLMSFALLGVSVSVILSSSYRIKTYNILYALSY